MAKVCTIPSCTRLTPNGAGRMCPAHYWRFRQGWSDEDARAPIREDLSHPARSASDKRHLYYPKPEKRCTQPGCEKRHHIKGFCKAHHKRRIRGADAEAMAVPLGGSRKGRPIIAVCNVPGCDLPHLAHGLCRSHHAKRWRFLRDKAEGMLPLHADIKWFAGIGNTAADTSRWLGVPYGKVYGPLKKLLPEHKNRAQRAGYCGVLTHAEVIKLHQDGATLIEIAERTGVARSAAYHVLRTYAPGAVTPRPSDWGATETRECAACGNEFIARISQKKKSCSPTCGYMLTGRALLKTGSTPRGEKAYDLRRTGVGWSEVGHDMHVKGSKAVRSATACKWARIHAGRMGLPWPVMDFMAPSHGGGWIGVSKEVGPEMWAKIERASDKVSPELRDDIRSELIVFLLGGGAPDGFAEVVATAKRDIYRASSLSKFTVSLDRPMINGESDSPPLRDLLVDDGASPYGTIAK